MDPFTLALLFGAAGAAKSELIDKPQAKRDRTQEAVKTNWGFLTGEKGSAVKEPNPFAAAMQYGMAGASLGQNMETLDMQKQLMKKLGPGDNIGLNFNTGQGPVAATPYALGLGQMNW